MHLTDLEMLTLKNAVKSNSESEHLHNCSACQKRYENRLLFTQKLAKTYDSLEFEPKWEALESELNMNGDNDMDKPKPRLAEKWEHFLIAFAASLCIVVISPSLINTLESSHVKTKIKLSIEENKNLQERLSLVTPKSPYQLLNHQTLKLKLQDLDQQIQLSYLEDVSETEKLQLWESRKQLLLRFIEKMGGHQKTRTEVV
uniref:hypothetical protein n=1 Tax=Ningiella ruwaisensis TaxID=2364274 RepID=UPI00109F75FF|nr:hypothetical protein [Ningiella ruwaisensis]